MLKIRQWATKLDTINRKPCETKSLNLSFKSVKTCLVSDFTREWIRKPGGCHGKHPVT